MAQEPEVKNAIAFIDGQNLYRHAKDAFGHHHPNYDLTKLHGAVCAAKGWKPTLVRFYTGVPAANESEMWSGYWANRILGMKRAGIFVTTRPIRYHRQEAILDDGTATVVTTPQEKGVDVRLALDVVQLARTKQFDVGVIYSQDQDLAEVVQEVKAIAREQDRWIKLASAFPFGEYATYDRGIAGTDWFKIDQDMYNKCLDPYDYRPKKFQPGA
jgi:uncharacterized LabA/DUF88 family protein